jgi:outer membrane protein assembly factor BamB
VATLGGVRQLVGYDRTSLGGWDISTGNRLWTLKPPHSGDFNVPTPVVVDGRLVVVSENNGARAYDFDHAGRIRQEPVAVNDELAPDVSSPAVAGGRMYCVWNDFYCLDAADSLRTIWVGEDKAFGDSSPLFVTDERVLAFGAGGELMLVDATAPEFHIISRLHLFEDRESRRAEQLSHPALVGTRLYLRGEKELVCVDLDTEAE